MQRSAGRPWKSPLDGSFAICRLAAGAASGLRGPPTSRSSACRPSLLNPLAEAAAAVKKDANFLVLSGLVDAILARSDWNLGRETKAALPLLKSLGDRSAHNRYFMARKADVDRMLPGLRVAVEDLLHYASLVR